MRILKCIDSGIKVAAFYIALAGIVVVIALGCTGAVASV